MRPLRIAAIGAGGMATGHFLNLCNFEDTELVAIGDILSNRRSASATNTVEGPIPIIRKCWMASKLMPSIFVHRHFPTANRNLLFANVRFPCLSRSR